MEEITIQRCPVPVRPIIKAARSTKIYKKDISPHYGRRK